jgi:hypothetical protein
VRACVGDLAGVGPADNFVPVVRVAGFRGGLSLLMICMRSACLMNPLLLPGAGRRSRDSRDEAAKQVKLIYIQEISMDRTTTRSCVRRAGLYIVHPESLTADNSTGDAGLPDRGSVGTKLLGTERTSDHGTANL